MQRVLLRTGHQTVKVAVESGVRLEDGKGHKHQCLDGEKEMRT